MRKTLLLAAAALAALGACSKGPPTSVDRMARSEVEAIVKDYLVNNPEVMTEALEALGRHERQKTFESLIANQGDPMLGPKDAKVTIVEFTDYNCGYCRAANEWVFEQIDAKSNDVRVIFKEYPIIHPTSLEAAKAALAADRQGKYREMHVALMKSKDLSAEGLEKTGKSVGLNIEKMKKDMADPGMLEHIQRVMSQGEQAAVAGTPGFFINGEFFNGFDEKRLNPLVKAARDAAKS